MHLVEPKKVTVSMSGCLSVCLSFLVTVTLLFSTNPSLAAAAGDTYHPDGKPPYQLIT